VNVHTSLLPKYRGAAPIQWAILNGDAKTGVTIMKMDPGLDTGDILTQEVTPINPSDNAQILHDRLAEMGASLLVRTLPAYVAGAIQPQPQPAEGATYARKITKEDGRLDWAQPAQVLWNRVRAFTPWPGAFTFLANEPRQPLLKIWQAQPEASTTAARPGEVLRTDRAGIVVACGRDALRILQLQREGGRRLDAQQFLTGYPLAPGIILG
jgi:methionyl-tRNA formyltransferase